MSSEGSQLGSTMGDTGNNVNLPYDYSSATSVGPGIREAAQGLAHLAMLARRDRSLQYSDDGADPSMSQRRSHIPGHAPYQHAGHSESFSRGAARAAARGGPSYAEEGETTCSARSLVQCGATDTYRSISTSL